MTARILLGTASWTDKPLIESGQFYPASAKSPEARLRYYATRFPLVEVDSSYYGLPTESAAGAWLDRTPPGFVFDIKAYSLFTDHPSPVSRLPKEISESLPGGLRSRRNLYRQDAPPQIVDRCWSWFVDAVMPLHQAGRLGVVVFQFPKWFFPGNRAYSYFWEIRDRLGPLHPAFEFRNDRWMAGDQRETTLNLLGDVGATYVCVDEPQGFSSSVPPVAAATSDLAFVRFHGRNATTWEKRTATSSERFDHWYAADELDEWVPRIATLAEATRDVHLVMNTNNYNQGPANLELLQQRLALAGLDVVPPFAH